MFRGALGFDAGTSRHQHNKIDILLDVAKKSHIVVEIKQHGKFRRAKKLEDAMKQATRYALHLKSAQPFAIVTDSDCWVYLAIEKPVASLPTTQSRLPHRIHKLMQFSVQSHPELAHLILKRSHHNTLQRLFELLFCVRQNLTPDSFRELMKMSLDDRVEFFKVKAQEAGIKWAQADAEIIQSLFDGASDVASSLAKEIAVEYRPVAVAGCKKRPSKARSQKAPAKK